METIHIYFAVTRCLFGVGSVIWGLEFLMVRHEMCGGRILSWRIGQLRYVWSSRGRGAAATELIYGDRAVILWPVARIAAGVMLLLPGLPHSAYAAGFAIAALSSTAWFLRAPQGQDGSDQIFLLLSVSLALAYTIDTTFAYLSVAGFMAAQLTVCYVTAGVTKALSHEWRDGQAIRLVFRTYNYGDALVYRLSSWSPVFSVVLAWGVIGLEIAFPLLFLVNYNVAVVLLTFPLLLHLATAKFMGLNLFFVSFLAAYPLLVLSLKYRLPFTLL